MLGEQGKHEISFRCIKRGIMLRSWIFFFLGEMGARGKSYLEKQ